MHYAAITDRLAHTGGVKWAVHQRCRAMKAAGADIVELTIGEHDIVLDVMCRDSDHLNELIRERIQKIEGVHYTTTNIYLKVLKTAQPEIKQFFMEEENGDR